MASVKVAVRVRPFNKRELNLHSESVVLMEKQSVSLLPPPKSGDSARPHAFTFDYAYYSHDPSEPHFVTQETVFENLGLDVVSNAFKGYNVCVFAYGQTGSGKTYTMMGSEGDPGLIPRICQELFDRMKNNCNSTSYRTEVSYLEIYNEKVKDLLGDDGGNNNNSNSNNKKGAPGNPGGGGHNLKVREDPRSGPYVQNLSKHLVLEYDAIISLMSKGNSERTTASTNMNNTSSRSHAIFTITFTQASVLDNGLPRETISKVHLVDLAGSERADATGATGQRLKEGAHINKSLVTLGSVISALADASNASQQSNNKKVFVPYRDSVLTWLLRDSLGGNSQTIMIATISPADVNHGETLSTLRYANRAKNIINKPTVNEDPNVKLIRELREEIERLKESLIVTTPDPVVATEIAVKEARERTLTEAWTEKWREAANILSEQKALGLKRTGLGVVLDSEKPHLIGIVEDVLSTGIILYHLKEGNTLIGSLEAPESDIVLRGPAILPRHCVINLQATGTATLTPQPGALVLVNASRIPDGKTVKLSQGCVLVLGKTNMFRYNDPSEVESLRKNMMTSSGEYYSSNQSLLSESLSDLRTSRSGGLEALNQSSAGSSTCPSEAEEEEDVQAIVPKNKKKSKNNSKRTNIQKSSQLVEHNEEEEVLPKSSSTLSLSSYQEDEDLSNNNNTSSSHQLHNYNNHNYSSLLSSDNSTIVPNDYDDLDLEEEEETAAGGSSSNGAHLNRLYHQILEQKEVIMKCLENESVDVESLNEEIVTLQEMQGLYEKQEFERIRRLWLYSKRRGGKSHLHKKTGDHCDEEEIDLEEDGHSPLEVEEKLAMLVEQEVDRRLFQEKILKAESEYHEREHLRSECEREINVLRRQHEREIYILKRKLYESHVAVVSGSLRPLGPHEDGSDSLIGVNQAYPVIASIPSYRTVSTASPDAHVEYEVRLTFCLDSRPSTGLLPKGGIGGLLLYRRYKTFRDLHMALMSKYGPHLSKLSFPPRKFIVSSLSPSLSRERQRALQIYLNCLLQILSKIPSSPLFLIKDPRAALLALSPFFKEEDEVERRH